MYYRQEIEGFYKSKCGSGGLSEDDFIPYLPKLDQAVEAIRTHKEKGTLPLLTLPYMHKDLAEVDAIATRFQDEFSDVIILGTGGSSLGGQTLCALAPTGGVKLHFVENIDPDSIYRLLNGLPTSTTGFLVISKSGETPETLMQFLICAGKWVASEGESALRDHFVVITEDKSSTLKRLVDHWEIPWIPHDPHLGGRFSALSVVGLLPAMILGLDPAAFREGARQVLEDLLLPRPSLTKEPALGALSAVILGERLPNTVMMPYVDQLALFTKWYRQLWAESLGKKGKGTMPITALGTVDQHSQLQLYLDGPKNNAFTLLFQKQFPADKAVRPEIASVASFCNLVPYSMGQLLEACGRGTYQALLDHGCPTRLFTFDLLTPTTLGALLMHFMLETILAAYILDINAFDQPAVEAGKKLTRTYLEEMPHALHSPAFSSSR